MFREVIFSVNILNKSVTVCCTLGILKRSWGARTGIKEWKLHTSYVLNQGLSVCFLTCWLGPKIDLRHGTQHKNKL